MNKLKDYLNPKLTDFRNKQIEFFEKTNLVTGINNTVLDIDYKIYSECLEAYVNTGINYYDNYIFLRYAIQDYKLQKGIKGKVSRYYNPPCFETYETYKKALEDCIALYDFFDINECCGVHIMTFKKLLENAEIDWNTYINKGLEEEKRKAKNIINKLKNNYLNFDNFNELKLEKLYLEYKEHTKPSNRYSVKELMDMNIELYDGSVCLLFGFLGDKIQFVGKTTRIFNYIYNKNKEFKIDNVAIFIVDEEYIDDLYVELIVKGDIQSSSNTINHKCMKYVSYNKAKSYYKSIYGLSAWDIKRAIKKHNIETFTIASGTQIINKIKLHRAIEEELK